MTELNEQMRAEFEAIAREMVPELWANPERMGISYADPHLRTGWAFFQAARRQHGSAARAVGEIVADDPVHGWHMRAYLPWDEIGAGTKLFTAPPVADAEGVKTWQARIESTGRTDQYAERDYMLAEIADLRAALSRLNGEKK